MQKYQKLKRPVYSPQTCLEHRTCLPLSAQRVWKKTLSIPLCIWRADADQFLSTVVAVDIPRFHVRCIVARIHARWRKQSTLSFLRSTGAPCDNGIWTVLKSMPTLTKLLESRGDAERSIRGRHVWTTLKGTFAVNGLKERSSYPAGNLEEKGTSKWQSD